MNLGILRALLLDAFYQVMDNLMFRILVGLVALLVMPTWVVGLREDELVVLFGVKSYPYEEFLGFLSAFGVDPAARGAVYQQLISKIQSLYLDWVGGAPGIIFCIAATAFFLPRMMEKGAADTVFSKPVSRLTLLLARYFTGVFFVAFLSAGLVGGLYLGFRIGSGWDDKTILWTAVTITYQFALLHAFSSLVATISRSSIVAILCTFLLFGTTGCVNRIWVAKEYELFRVSQVEAELGDEDAEASKAEEEDDESHPFIRFLELTLESLHYGLPKTYDADIITSKVRSTIAGEGMVFEMDGENFGIRSHPEGFGPDSLEDLDGAGLSWVQMGAEGVERARLTLTRKLRQPPATEDQPKPRRLSSSTARKELQKDLAGRPEVVGDSEVLRRVVSRSSAYSVSWTEKDGADERSRQTTFFTYDEHLYTFELTAMASTWDEDTWDQSMDEFLMEVRLSWLSHTDWYEGQLSWTSQMKYNTFFSIGSSLLFAILCLALAWWKLARVDF